MQDFIYNDTDSGEIFNNNLLSNTLRSIDESLTQDLRQLINQLIANVDGQLFLLADNSRSIDDQNQNLALMHLLHINKQGLVEKGTRRLRDQFIQQYQSNFAYSANSFPAQLTFNWSNDSKQQYQLEKLTESFWHKLHKENLEKVSHINATLNSLFSCQFSDLDFPLSAMQLSHAFADLFIKTCHSASDSILIMKALIRSGSEFGYFYSQQRKRLSLFAVDARSETLKQHGDNVAVKIKSYRRDSSVDQINQDMLVNTPPLHDATTSSQSDTLSSDMELCLNQLQSVINLPGSKLKEQSLFDVIGDRLNRQFSSNESRAIVLVDNLFTRIMSDKTLPHVVRDQIENLKIPCVKLALDQSRLFLNKSHPMIKLIDMIAEATLLMSLIRGEPEEDDPMLLAIRDAVQRLCFGYTDDDSLIADINATLQFKISQQVLKSKEKYEKQREKRLALVNTLKCKLHSQNVPTFISRFVRDIWYKVLNLNSDTSTSEYEALHHLLDDLIWSVQPKRLEQEKRLLLQMIPKLVNNIRHAISQTYISEEKCERFIAELEAVHINSLQGRQLSNDQTDSDAHEARQDAVLIEDIEKDSWVRFVQNQRTYFLRLDYYNDFSREYSFVDSAYQKIIVLNKEELANCLSLGEMELRADQSLFSRALSAVV